MGRRNLSVDGVITHPLLALTQKLDFQQLAPLGFIWMRRLIVDLSGVIERTLRLFPFECRVPQRRETL